MKKPMIRLFLYGLVVLVVVATLIMVTTNQKTKASDAFLNEPYAFVTTQGTTMTVLFIEKKGNRIKGKMDRYDTIFNRDGSHEVKHIPYKITGNTLRHKLQDFTMYLQNEEKVLRLSGSWSKEDVYLTKEPEALEANFEPVTKEGYETAIRDYNQAMDNMIVEWED